ncbi:hypothetical protein KUCAC02_022156 [Chaenocephalus aceratus]|nr:hypothetical protein KUCAC02_035543 [Chaenocephalus aceratus]KAI4798280.1 hypothetical protein KUCAC02_022156 [Chaenocephalus aceratus]
MATPLLRILNPQAPGDRQQAVVVPSKEVRCYTGIREMLFPHLRWSCSVRPLPWPKQRSSFEPTGPISPHASRPGKAGLAIWPVCQRTLSLASGT